MEQDDPVVFRTLSISRSLDTRIRELAHVHGTSKTAIIREVLGKGLPVWEEEKRDGLRCR